MWKLKKLAKDFYHGENFVLDAYETEAGKLVRITYFDGEGHFNGDVKFNLDEFKNIVRDMENYLEEPHEN